MATCCNVKTVLNFTTVFDVDKRDEAVKSLRYAAWNFTSCVLNITIVTKNTVMGLFERRLLLHIT